MSRTVSALSLTMVLLAGPSLAETIDKIIATIDDEVILQSDIELSIEPLIPQLRLDYDTEREFAVALKELIAQVLEENIHTKLLYRAAQLDGRIEISDEKVEEGVESWRKNRGYATLQEFVEDLNKNAMTVSEFKEIERKRIMASTMVEIMRGTFSDEVEVSETQIVDFYEQNQSQYTKAERVQLRQIVLMKEGVPPSEHARLRAKLEAIRKELEGGTDFAELARAHSQASGAEEGGKVGLTEWIERENLTVALEEPAFSLPVGGVSEIIETQFGFHLLKVVKKEEEEFVPFEEVWVEIEERIRYLETEKMYFRWFDDLRRRSGVRIFL